METQDIHNCNDRDFSFIEWAAGLFPDRTSRKPFLRVCSLMRHQNVKWMLVERSLQEKDCFQQHDTALEEYTGLMARPDVGEVDVTRVTFIRGRRPDPDSDTPILDQVPRNKLLACCLVFNVEHTRQSVPSPTSYMFECVMPPPPYHVTSPTVGGADRPTHFYHVIDEAPVRIENEDDRLAGAYFAQQNGITSACAHACLRMALWHVTARMLAPVPSIADINGLVVLYRRQFNRPLPQQKHRSLDPNVGLYSDEIVYVCEHFNAKTFTLDLEGGQIVGVSPYEYAYLLVESGIPTLIGFTTSGAHANAPADGAHLLFLNGHTFDTGQWLPIAVDQHHNLQRVRSSPLFPYISSAEWAPHFIAHDDMLGPYLSVDHPGFAETAGARTTGRSRIIWVVGIMPKEDPMPGPPQAAQGIAAGVFWEQFEHILRHVGAPWRKRLQDEPLTPGTLVLRTQLVKKEQYLKHLRHAKNHRGRPLRLLRNTGTESRLRTELPELFWMTEFSQPWMFTTARAKLGEILLPFWIHEDPWLAQIRDDNLPISHPRADHPPIVVRFLDCVRFLDGHNTINPMGVPGSASATPIQIFTAPRNTHAGAAAPD